MSRVRCAYDPAEDTTQQLTSTPESRRIAETLSLTTAIINVVDQTNKLLHVDVERGTANLLEVDIAEAFPAKASWVLLRERGVVMVCGGLEKEARTTVLGVHVNSCIGFVLQPLLAARGEAGIVQTAGRVYLFGGRNPQFLKSCEFYDLENNLWQSLPDMTSARACVTPVLWKSSILLVGGTGGVGMEVMTLPQHQFHAVSLQLPYSDQLTVAIAVGEQLVVLQRDQVVGASLRGSNRTVYPIATLPKPGFWFSPTEPLEVNGCIYFLDWACDAAIWRWDSSEQLLTVAVQLA